MLEDKLTTPTLSNNTTDPFINLNYQTGFNNYFESEAFSGALIKGRNSPQKHPLGLYAEQLSGSAFTSARHHNLHSWLYKLRPGVMHGEFKLLTHPFFTNQVELTPPTQMRWDPLPYPAAAKNFIESIVTFAVNDCAAIHLYAATESMRNEFFYNADGELLIVPQEGFLKLHTEFGVMGLTPGEIAVIPRGIKFQVELLEDKARGYICENYGSPFRLPELGVIGANGLANARDFETPVASFKDMTGDFKLIAKFQNRLWIADIDHSPLNVVAWHGNYVPFKYNLSRFNTINTVSFDHPDPSIFTVLTAPSAEAGVANVDFVIFPPRWMVANDTFRPPYYHRNIMNEYMGLIFGTYDAKEKGFVPGSGSLHNCMSAHGPDADAFEKAVNAKLVPEYYDNVLAFMFESRSVWQLTAFALNGDLRQRDYLNCWQGLKPAKF